MTRCRHAHHHHSTTADVWTTLAATGEAITSFISDGYGLSWYGMGFGAALSLILTVGTTYSHMALNLHHQDDQHASHTDEAGSHEHASISIEEEDHPPAEPQEDSHLTHHADEGSLTHLQRAALVADFISHTGDTAGPLTFIANIATKNTLPLWAKGVAQGGATLFGGLTAIANVRTCKNSMLALNKKRAATDEEHLNSIQHTH